MDMLGWIVGWFFIGFLTGTFFGIHQEAKVWRHIGSVGGEVQSGGETYVVSKRRYAS